MGQSVVVFRDIAAEVSVIWTLVNGVTITRLFARVYGQSQTHVADEVDQLIIFEEPPR